MSKKEKFTSSGNIFADIGIENPEETLAKAEIVQQIYITIKKKKLTQAKQRKRYPLLNQSLLNTHAKDSSKETRRGAR
jgi:hypothetical protein